MEIVHFLNTISLSIFMDCKIFYSWQSDLPNSTNRGFIQDALNKAVKSLRNDDFIEVEPVIDRDTQNVAGAPDIVKTIFDKIEQAQIFVCDVSIINADFFLFLLSESKTKDSSDSDSYLHGWSLLYMEQTPRYLLEAEKVKFAKQLLHPLSLETIAELRELVKNAQTKLVDKIWNNLGENYFLEEKPFLRFDPMDIGSVE